MKKLLSISLASLIILGSLSISHGTHYCMGLAVASEMMIGHHELSCGMTDMGSANHSDGMSFETDCCDNEYVSFENGDLFKSQISGQVFTTAFIAVGLAYPVILQNFSNEESSSHFVYQPPSPGEDLLTEFQVLRI